MIEQLFHNFISQLSWPFLIITIVSCLLVLAKGADSLVNQAVLLSSRSGIPKVVVGATIISLGTTAPEAAVSVFSAIQGRPGMALGNAVGSIICDTGLILGLACLISPLKLDKVLINRQGWIQLGCGALLIVSCLPSTQFSKVFHQGGNLSRLSGFCFLFLLFAYLWISTLWARKGKPLERFQETRHDPNNNFKILMSLLFSLGLVVASSSILVPSVSEASKRMQIPDSIIAATLVAFGTSLPELVTAITAARRNHGDLAIGNVIGADILNVLFVAGASAAATKNGLPAPSYFFSLYFPSMMFILIVFRIGTLGAKTHLNRGFGVILLTCYLAVTILSYVW